MKNIHEARMGPPKSYKTGAVVKTYPKPMLVLQGDVGGMDIITPADLKVMQQESIHWLKDEAALKTAVEIPRNAQPALSAYFFREEAPPDVTSDFGVIKDVKSHPKFAMALHTLLHSKQQPFPWKTVVLDPVTVLSEIALAHFGTVHAGKMEDARKWAGAVGSRVYIHLSHFNSLPCHTVAIFHSKEYRDELTQAITTEPIFYGQQRDMIGGLMSQFFYQNVEKEGPVIWTHPMQLVKGIGMRWPDYLYEKKTCKPDFDTIYGKAVERGETWK